MKVLKAIVFASLLSNYSLASAHWVAIAIANDGAWGISTTNKTQSTAKNNAIKQCQGYTKIPCNNVKTLNTTEPYVAVAQSKEWVEASTGKTLDIAMQSALTRCASHTSQDNDCNIVWKGFNGNFNQAKFISPANTTKTCRPNTNPIRCQSNCTNGNCVVTYENGCKVHIKVSPKYDPFQKRWKYPAAQC